MKILALVGMVPFPEEKGATVIAIPVYSDGNSYFFHKLNDKATEILQFDEFTRQRPQEMIELPLLLQRNVRAGDPALFVVVNKNILFAGTAGELALYAEGIKAVSGAVFIAELGLILGSI